MNAPAPSYFDRHEQGKLVEVMTPEGVPLHLRVALAGDRAGAFLLDFMFILVPCWGLAFLTVAAVGDRGGGTWLGAFFQLFWFLAWNFYFMFFELRWQGATPGKRIVGLRVIDRHGGPLTAEAVIVRNLTRDVEVFMPLRAIVAGGLIFDDSPGWGRFVGVLWLLLLALLPLFNKLRLRVGDIVAGTIVVARPRAVLLADQSAAAVAAKRYEFTDEALDVYGIYELQVLEEVLRRGEDGTPEAYLAMDAVCEKIQRKIGWDSVASGRVDPGTFLRDFYAALRARLEHRMLLGERKADKYARRKS